MRIVITGGGTGGHIYPGLAVAERLREEWGVEVLFIGGDRLEREIVPRAGIPFVSVQAARLPRNPGLGYVPALLRTAVGALQAARLLRRFRPHGVVAMGGYTSAPVAFAAMLMGIPILLQEQNVLPGITNRLVARWARHIAVGHEEARRYFPQGKAVVTGIPVRSRLFSGSRERALARFGLEPETATLLVMGGSQGAQLLNRVTLDALPRLDDAGVQVLHQTGRAHIAWVREEAGRMQQGGPRLRYIPFPYLDLEEMADAYAAADLVVCRAGATTLAEITALGLPAILIPYPHAAEGHQERNARVLAEAGAAVVIREDELDGARLAEQILSLLRDRPRLRSMAAASARCGRPDATQQVINLILGKNGTVPFSGGVPQRSGPPPGASIHFVGIGGAGMSAIAHLLLARGYRVSGSDLRASEATRRLEALGARIAIGHRAENVGNPSLIVASRAIAPDNPELTAAAALGIPVLHRAEMLSRILQEGFSIAVTGTHGKTTTTAMTTAVATAAGLDPTALIGADVPDLGGNVRLGRPDLLIAEVDESDGSFLHVTPTAAVITSLDATDHLDYYGDLSTLSSAFQQFLSAMDAGGFVVGCADSPLVRDVLSGARARVVTYALESPATYTASSVVLSGRTAKFVVLREGRPLGEVALRVPGRHNVANALAALATGLELGVSLDQAVRGLEAFSGVERRFAIKEVGGVLIVDDYAHNPTKVSVALRTAREGWPDRRIIAVFQPHRYTRTKTSFAQFGPVFKDADEVIITEIYPADEPPLPGVTADLIVDAVRAYRPVRYRPSLEEALREVMDLLRPGDLVLTMGAGDVWKLARELASRLSGVSS